MKKSVVVVLSILLALWSLFFGFALLMLCYSSTYNLSAYLITGAIELVLIVSLVVSVKRYNPKTTREEAKIEKMIARGEKEYYRELKHRPVAAVLIGTQDGSTKALARGALGYVALGPVGAAVGLADSKSKAVFSVKYADGHTGTETVTVGSERFNVLSALLLK